MKRKRIGVPSLLAVCALLAGAGAAGCSSDSSGGGGQRISLEAAGVVAANPFLKAPEADLPGTRPLPGARAGGAFGGTPGKTHCDKLKLIAQITADPVEAAAWAKVRNVPVERIGEHIMGMNEDVVPEDTLVKNHNYEGNGRTVEYLSVLQSGTAILRDPYDSPAVKCNCGNPLLQPDRKVDRASATYTGTRWQSFEVTQITVVVTRTEEQGPRRTVPYVDVQHPDRGFDRPAGSSNGADDSRTYPVPLPKPPTPSASGASGTPTGGASGSSSGAPSDSPSGSSSGSSTGMPSGSPSGSPSSGSPSSAAPSDAPTGSPSHRPSSAPPTKVSPTKVPPTTRIPAPVTSEPPPRSHAPSSVPTGGPPTREHTTAAPPPTVRTAPPRSITPPEHSANGPSATGA
ncbi:DUF6777 domain-containing protein [Streptomyces sp. NPDC049555]|uniref:DUF6777 domain-containing protein n=1 Tax=Streptomyces sp. NPDC049555 TaxID=3154930 RepID=UPI00342A820E